MDSIVIWMWCVLICVRLMRKRSTFPAIKKLTYYQAIRVPRVKPIPVCVCILLYQGAV